MKSVLIIQKLQTTNSRLDKEAILLEAWNSGNREFFEAVKLCLDGLVSFGVKQIPIKEQNSGNEWLKYEHFRNLAMDLAGREITGHAARDTLISNMEACNIDDWNLFYRPVLLKDLRAGLNEATFNKVLKKIGTKEALQFLIPEFPYMRCCLAKDTNLSEFDWKTGVLSQIKSDGMFVNINIHETGEVEILSRSGKAFPLDVFADMVDNIKNTFCNGYQIHGELLVEKGGKILPREIGNGMLNSVAQGEDFKEGHYPILHVWDQIPLKESVSKGFFDMPYKDRFEELEALLLEGLPSNIKLIETKIVHSLAEAYDHYKELIAKGFEGTIIKDPNAIWKDGTSKQQVKLKVECEIDLEIVGFNPGNGKNAHLFGSIQCRSADGLLEVNVSGFKDKEREEIHKIQEELIGTIVTVRSNSIMKPTVENKYSLFLPRFVEFRKDKTEADSLQKIIDQFESVLKSL